MVNHRVSVHTFSLDSAVRALRAQRIRVVEAQVNGAQAWIVYATEDETPAFDLPLMPFITEPLPESDDDTKIIPAHLRPDYAAPEGDDVSAPREPEFDSVDRGETPVKKAA